MIHTSSEDEDFKKPTEGYSGQPEYTTKDHYDKKLKMNFMVFNMKKRRDADELPHHPWPGAIWFARRPWSCIRFGWQ